MPMVSVLAKAFECTNIVEPGRDVLFTNCMFDDVVCAIVGDVYDFRESQDRKRPVLC